MTTLTPCPQSQWLRQHSVRVVNDYFSMCLRSQQLCRHGVSVVNDYTDTQFSKISNYMFCNFFSLVFFNFFQSKIIFVSQRSCWVCWHDVREVVDYADTCHCSCLPRWHRVGVVVDYTDTVSGCTLTMRTQVVASIYDTIKSWYNQSKFRKKLGQPI